MCIGFVRVVELLGGEGACSLFVRWILGINSVKDNLQVVLVWEFRVMPRIQGVDVPGDKVLYVSLSYIYGVGRRNALDICKSVGLDPLMPAAEITDNGLAALNVCLDSGFVVEGQLRRSLQLDINRLKDVKCYRGMRHRRGLPVRGQRTRTNSRTRKGVKKTVAGKKGVKDMKH